MERVNQTASSLLCSLCGTVSACHPETRAVTCVPLCFWGRHSGRDANAAHALIWGTHGVCSTPAFVGCLGKARSWPGWVSAPPKSREDGYAIGTAEVTVLPSAWRDLSHAGLDLWPYREQQLEKEVHLRGRKIRPEGRGWGALALPPNEGLQQGWSVSLCLSVARLGSLC